MDATATRPGETFEQAVAHRFAQLMPKGSPFAFSAGYDRTGGCFITAHHANGIHIRTYVAKVSHPAGILTRTDMLAAIGRLNHAIRQRPRGRAAYLVRYDEAERDWDALDENLIDNLYDPEPGPA